MGRRIYYRPEDVQQFIAAHVRGSHGSSDKKSQADRMSDTREAVTSSLKPHNVKGRLFFGEHGKIGNPARA